MPENHEEKDSIILTPPIDNRPDFNVLFGMFADGKLLSEEFMREKQIEKELEN